MLCSLPTRPLWLVAVRCIATTSPLQRIVAGRYYPTRRRNKPLTHDMSIRPDYIGVRKAWMTWHSENLEDFKRELAESVQPRIVAQDEIIHRFLHAIWTETLLHDEVIIKRRGNMIVLATFVYQRASPRIIYWLIGYTEELLTLILKQPVKLELQSVPNRMHLIYKYI